MTGLEALKIVEKDCEDLEQVPYGEFALIEKSLKALEIIKEKPQAELSLIQLGKTKTYEEYLEHARAWDLEYWDMVYEEEEFNLLIEVLK